MKRFYWSALLSVIAILTILVDAVKAGQTLIALDTPELKFAVAGAEASLRSAESYAKLQSYKRVKDRRKGKVFFDIVAPEVRQRADAKVQQAQAALEIA